MIIVFLVRTGVLGGICALTSFSTAVSKRVHMNLLHACWVPFMLACAIYCIIIFSMEYENCNTYVLDMRGYSAMIWILVDSCFVILWLILAVVLVISALFGVCVCGFGICLFAINESKGEKKKEKVIKSDGHKKNHEQA